MGKILFVSNRLPVTVSKHDKELTYEESIGGLATGLKSFYKHGENLWIGWPGLSDDELKPKSKKEIQTTLEEEYQCVPVFLSEDDIDQYYYGFSNNTIWPLFHYFTNKTEYDAKTWTAYKKVNQKFFDALAPHIEGKDIIWVHDYQLMLLPQMIKEAFPEAQVGFFLHIPFPSFEIFRLLIWRKEILEGILGADLVGFHTYDYVRHFLSSVRRLLGAEHNLNTIIHENRRITIDAFPMGIDYDRFTQIYDDEMFQKETREIIENTKGLKTILSIDRLDYTKGIPERIKAYSRFLEKYPQYRGKVRLNLIVAPSRVQVESYEDLRREITELVGEINGTYGTVSWMPLWFFFQSFSQERLIVFYRHSDVLLVTPLRDGMNLVAKEYIASRTDHRGMLVISETAGAASELTEAIIVNPNDSDDTADGIKYALEMSQKEKNERNERMHKRIERYNVDFWATEFLGQLERTVAEQVTDVTRNIGKNSSKMEKAYKNAKKRVLFLDYDGTLVGFQNRPDEAKPDKELKELLRKLVQDPKNTVVIISGRNSQILDEWLGDIPLNMLACHGLWMRGPEDEWAMTVSLENDWKGSIRHVLEMYTDRMPGSFIEEKDYSLVFHYRQCEPDMIEAKLNEVKETLTSMIRSTMLSVQEGNKVLEIKDSRTNKGHGAVAFMQNQDFDFILGVGDDTTDEDLFAALPDSAFSIKVGLGPTKADYYLRSWKSMRELLRKLAKIDE